MALAEFEINGVARQVSIGRHAGEMQQKQAMSFDIVVRVKPTDSLFVDRYDVAFDYDCVMVALDEAIAVKPHYQLQEALAFEVARRLLGVPGVEEVDVKTRKSTAYPTATFAGFRLAISRSEMLHLSSTHPTQVI